jgi:gamma-tubulin complex component 2
LTFSRIIKPFSLSSNIHSIRHPAFSLQKLWFYVHPTIHSLSLIYQLILELTNADDPSADLLSESSSEEDPEEAARNDALGLGGAKLKAVLSEMNNADIAGLPGGSGLLLREARC